MLFVDYLQLFSCLVITCNNEEEERSIGSVAEVEEAKAGNAPQWEEYPLQRLRHTGLKI